MYEEIYNCSFDEASKKLADFWMQYRPYYPDYKRKFLDKAIFHKFTYFENIPDVLLEIYIYLGVLKPELNHYNKFIDFYEHFFENSYDKAIVEVGTGSLPILSISINKMITFYHGNGHIIGYDPELAMEVPTIELKKEKFTLSTNISGVDLLMGFFPCEATEIMLEKALKEEKELCLQLCGCVPEYYDDEITSQEWLNILNRKIINNISNAFTYELVDIGVRPEPVIALKRK